MNQNTINIVRQRGISLLHMNPKFAYDTGDRSIYNLSNIIHKIAEMIRISLKIFFLMVNYDIRKIYCGLSSNKYAFLKDFIFLIYPLLLKKEIIIHLHLSNLLEFYKSSGLIIKRIFRWIIAGNTIFIVLSDNLKRSFEKLIPSNRIIVINNGIDFPKYDSKRNKDKNELICLYLGILLRSKGYFTVLQSASLVKDRNVIFYIVGPPGPDYEEKEVMDYIAANGLADKVNICGPKYGEDKEELYAKSDIFIFPSSFAPEAMPLVLLEAMAYGLCIIATSKGAIPEIVEDQNNGFIVDHDSPSEIAQRIIYLSNNRDKLNIIYENNVRKFKERFSLNKYEREILKLFE